MSAAQGQSSGNQPLENTERLKQRLLERREELLEDLRRFETEAREGSGGDVEDPVDQVESGELKAGTFAVSSMRRDLLNQIDGALQRLHTGDYGKCIDCGRPIEPDRLNAVPWTQYCLEDQEKHDQERSNETIPDIAP
jgi:DnaK suppressor protein